MENPRLGLFSRRSEDGAPPTTGQRKTFWLDEPKPFLDHLEDFRRLLISIAALLCLGMFLTFPLMPSILVILRQPLAGITDSPEDFLRSLDVTGAFAITLRVGFWVGLLLAAPGIILLLLRFVFPALRDAERKALIGIGIAAPVLFAGGALLGYFLALPNALKILFAMHAWLDIRAEWTITSYVAFSVQLLLGFGLAFELPALLLALGRLNILSAAMLSHWRRHAIISIFVIAMILTPPDIVSQLLMALPMLLLYEVCVLIIRAWERAG